MANEQLTQVANIERILSETGHKLGISATRTTDASGAINFSVNFNQVLSIVAFK
jgi:hypothetical protein